MQQFAMISLVGVLVVALAVLSGAQEIVVEPAKRFQVKRFELKRAAADAGGNDDLRAIQELEAKLAESLELLQTIRARHEAAASSKMEKRKNKFEFIRFG